MAYSFPAPSGRAIRAIASGQVIFANWLRGYGNMLIINHKGGYMTLYAHSNALLKQIGDQVKPGEEIALVGNSGGLIIQVYILKFAIKARREILKQWCR